MKIFSTLALMVIGTAAMAQGVVVETLPNVKPLPPAESGINGRVEGLNATAYDALAEIRSRKLVVTDERVAPYLQAALLKDGKIDAAEADLLNELTQPRIRSINVSREGSASTEPTLTTGNTGGLAKKIYFDTLYPAEELAASLAKGESEWKALIGSARTYDGREAQITQMLAEKLAQPLKESSSANAYKPVAQAITQYYNWSVAAGPDPDTVMDGRILVYRAAYTADMKADNVMPDFLYSWLKNPPKAAN
jgi:hypothetical protein